MKKIFAIFLLFWATFPFSTAWANTNEKSIQYALELLYTYHSHHTNDILLYQKKSLEQQFGVNVVSEIQSKNSQKFQYISDQLTMQSERFKQACRQLSGTIDNEVCYYRASSASYRNSDSFLMAKKFGLTTALSVSQMNLQAFITRDEVAVIVERAMKNMPILSTFQPSFENVLYRDEANISQEFKNATKLLQKFGIMRGDDQQYFHPKRNLTHFEAAIIAARLFGNRAFVNNADAVNFLESYLGIAVNDEVLYKNISRQDFFDLIINAHRWMSFAVRIGAFEHGRGEFRSRPMLRNSSWNNEYVYFASQEKALDVKDFYVKIENEKIIFSLCNNISGDLQIDSSGLVPLIIGANHFTSDNSGRNCSAIQKQIESQILKNSFQFTSEYVFVEKPNQPFSINQWFTVRSSDGFVDMAFSTGK